MRITPNGNRSYAQVTLPTGLEFSGGKLFASAWSLGLTGSGAGEVVRIAPGAFAIP